MVPTKYVIIRCGPMGACMASSANPDCQWVEAFWQRKDEDKVVDATGPFRSRLLLPIRW